MAIFIIPKCPVCKNDKNVVWKTAEIKDMKTWFDIIYCTKCYTVISCNFSGKVLRKTPRNRSEKEDELEELNKLQ